MPTYLYLPSIFMLGASRAGSPALMPQMKMRCFVLHGLSTPPAARSHSRPEKTVFLSFSTFIWQPVRRHQQDQSKVV